MPPGETITDDTETLSDRELLLRLARQADHIDTMCHELIQFVDEHRPALTRALGLLDPSRGWRAWRNGGRADAVQE